MIRSKKGSSAPLFVRFRNVIRKNKRECTSLLSPVLIVKLSWNFAIYSDYIQKLAPPFSLFHCLFQVKWSIELWDGNIYSTLLNLLRLDFKSLSKPSTPPYWRAWISPSIRLTIWSWWALDGLWSSKQMNVIKLVLKSINVYSWLI